MFGGLIVRLVISEGETATRSGQMSIPRYRPTIGFLQRSGSYHRRRLASDPLKRTFRQVQFTELGLPVRDKFSWTPGGHSRAQVVES